MQERFGMRLGCMCKKFRLSSFTGRNEELSSFAKEMDGSNGKHLQDSDKTGKYFSKISFMAIRINILQAISIAIEHKKHCKHITMEQYHAVLHSCQKEYA